MNSFASSNFATWMMTEIFPKGLEIIEQAFMLTWSIWSSRNKFIFEYRPLDVLALVKVTVDLLHDYFETLMLNQHAPTSADQLVTTWRPF